MGHPPKTIVGHVLPSAPRVTSFIAWSVVIFLYAFQADNIGDRTSVLHSTPVRHPPFSWYLAIVSLLSFFFLFFLSKQGSGRVQHTHGNTNPRDINGAGFAKAWYVQRENQSLELSHFQDSTEGNAWAGIICAADAGLQPHITIVPCSSENKTPHRC